MHKMYQFHVVTVTEKCVFQKILCPLHTDPPFITPKFPTFFNNRLWLCPAWLFQTMVCSYSVRHIAKMSEQAKSTIGYLSNRQLGFFFLLDIHCT